MRSDVRKIVLAVLLCLVLLGAALVSWAMCNGSINGQGCTAATPLGWTIPIASLIVIPGVAWLLLSKTPDDPSDGAAAHSLGCPSCGRVLLDGWRICPYCGKTLGVERATGGEEVVT